MQGDFVLNQKGQAFSVFELMIAGVVAFAILIILLMVINNVNTGVTSNPKDAISTAVKTVGVSGQTTSNVFSFKNGAQVSSDDISSQTGLDVGSLFFMTGQFGSDSTITVSSDGKSVLYTGSTEKKVQAIVNCKQNEGALSNSISVLSQSSSFSSYSFEPQAACGDVSPCCAIILIRPKN